MIKLISMKKCFIICLSFIFLNILPAFSDAWDDLSDVDKAWDGQKTITNKEYEDVINALEEKKEIGQEKKRKKLFKKIIGGGNTLHKDMGVENELKEIPELKKEENGILINLPVDIILDDNILERGYYQVIGERNDGSTIVKFYQSQFLKGEIKVTETNDDFNEDLIDFAKILPYNDGYVKLIFGSLDFNAYTFIPYKW